VIRILRTQSLEGFLHGLHQSSLTAWLEFSSGPGAAATGRRLTEILAPHLPQERPDTRPPPAGPRDASEAAMLAVDISAAAARVQEAVKIPVIGSARVARSGAGGPAVAPKVMTKEIL